MNADLLRIEFFQISFRAGIQDQEAFPVFFRDHHERPGITDAERSIRLIGILLNMREFLTAGVDDLTYDLKRFILTARRKLVSGEERRVALLQDRIIVFAVIDRSGGKA